MGGLAEVDAWTKRRNTTANTHRNDEAQVCFQRPFVLLRDAPPVCGGMTMVRGGAMRIHDGIVVIIIRTVDPIHPHIYTNTHTTPTGWSPSGLVPGP